MLLFQARISFLLFLLVSASLSTHIQLALSFSLRVLSPPAAPRLHTTPKSSSLQLQQQYTFTRSSSAVPPQKKKKNKMMMARIQEDGEDGGGEDYRGNVVLENIPPSLLKSTNDWHQDDAETLHLSIEEDDEPPSIADTDVSSVVSHWTTEQTTSTEQPPPLLSRLVPERLPLQWEFYGLTLWLEYEEFDYDLTKANYHFAGKYGTGVIPTLHSTIIYGMKHLSVDECKERLQQIPSVLPQGAWPRMERPVAVKQDIAIEGRPGQVCTIAWAELTLRSNDEHEQAMDAVCKLFGTERKGPWTPHLSLAYDNPDNHVLNLMDMIQYTHENPTLFQERRPKAVSLWDTNGKMGDWKCLDRVEFPLSPLRP
jgi:hypothetical protein